MVKENALSYPLVPKSKLGKLKTLFKAEGEDNMSLSKIEDIQDDPEIVHSQREIAQVLLSEAHTTMTNQDNREVTNTTIKDDLNSINIMEKYRLNNQSSVYFFHQDSSEIYLINAKNSRFCKETVKNMFVPYKSSA